MTKKLRTSLSFAVTLVFLIIVLRSIDVGELVQILRHAKPLYLLLALLMASLTPFTSAAKVRALLQVQGYDVSSGFLLKNCFIGLFFNNFLPTNVGGDVIRSYEIGRYINDQATGAASVFVERFTGFIVLVVMACMAFLTHLTLIENVTLTVVLLVAVAALLAVTWLAIDTYMLNWVKSRLPFAILHKYFDKFRKFQSALHRYRDNRGVLVQNFIWSFLFYVIVIVYVYAAVSIFHRPIFFWGVAYTVPITMLVAMIPLTFNSIGILEWSYVTLFPLIGIPAPAALLGLVVIRIITLLKAAIGGVIYLQMKVHQREGGASTGV